jgi:alpha-galactosidase
VNRGYLNVVDLTVSAAIEGDPRLVRQAAMVDPNTSASLSPPEIWALCDDMVAAHGSALPKSLQTALSPGGR